MTWRTIPDALVASYAPVTGRLMERYWRNIEALRTRLYAPLGWSATRSTTTTGFETIETWRWAIPDIAVGLGTPSTRLVLFFDFTLDTSSAAAAGFRLAVGADTSNEVNVSATSGTPGAETGALTLDWAPTAGTIVSVDLQMELGGTPDGGAVMTWIASTSAGENELIPLPVAA